MSKRLKSLTLPELLEFFVLFYERYKDEIPKTRKFKVAEIALLEDILFRKKYNNLPIYVADYIMDHYYAGFPITNAATIKRLKFFHYLFQEQNAAKAAIRAGYSRKSAKQQGYRTLKSIQRLVKEGK